MDERVGIKIRTCDEPMTIMCDNQNSIFLTKSPMFHESTKHFNIKFNFIKNVIS